MTDAVNVFQPGQRLTNSTTGAPLSGAVVKFFIAGTTTPKTVYADADLSTALGTSVTTDSLGYPTSDGTTKTLVYTDSSAYKVRIETSSEVLIAEHDNVKGAVEAGDGDGGTVIETRTVETKSLDYTVLATDQGKAFAGNCSGGDVVFTLPSAAAADVGNGWLITICHAGSANQVVIETVSSQTITSGVLSYAAALPLSFSGEEVTLISDGGNWRVFMHVGPQIKAGSTIITVADRLGAEPSEPDPGVMYLSTGSATWGSTSVANHDVVIHTAGGEWIKVTPPTDCGWMAYVQDEDIYYRFVGSAWAAESATTSVAGTVRLADQAAMEATTSGRVPTADLMHHHPGVAKCWAYVTYAGGTPTLQASYNITSITDTAEGRLTITIETDFSSVNWCSLATGTGDNRIVCADNKAAGSIAIRNTVGGSGAYSDPDALNFAGFGDQ